MRILGIDPGLNTTGYGVIELFDRDIILLEGGVIRTGPAADPLEARLSRLFDGIMEVLDQFRPEALALENLYSHYEHPTTAILMGHARGVICLAASKGNIPVFSYAATQIKSYLTGNGRSSKEQMQRAIQARLRLKEVPTPHDVADALAVAICHYSIITSPVMVAVGDHQRIAHVRRTQ
ncbi:MAG: crossover junction endodeoxyribonuclease RuvC [Chloroflexota bacterium]|nr:crossover junction endodeoxyribonuclease RuvC [Chloroflexota bacterium]